MKNEDPGFESWSVLIASGLGRRVQELSPETYHLIAKKLFPGKVALWFQLVTGFLLILSPPLFGFLSGPIEPGALPVILYAIYGVMTVLWIVPLATRIFRISGAELILASRLIDERLHIRKRAESAH